jgi:hypothetical protein
MLGNLLTNVIIWAYSTLQSVFSTPDYRIADSSMEYFLDYTKTPLPEELDEFWYEERNEWDDETESVFKTLNFSNYKDTTIPENVTKTVVRVKYWYNNTIHNEKVKIRDMLFYDMDTLENDFPKIKLKSAIGTTKIVSTVDGCITDLRVP